MNLKNTMFAGAALILSALTCSGAPAPPAKGQPVPLPESYTRFFPGVIDRQVRSLEGGVMEFGKVPSSKYVAQPRLKGVRKGAPKAGADADLMGYLYFFQGEDLIQGMYSIYSDGTSNFLWSDEYTSENITMTAGWLRNGNICGVNSFKMMGGMLYYGYIEVDAKTGDTVRISPLINDDYDQLNRFLTMAYRDLTDEVYGYSFNEDGSAYAWNKAPATDIDGVELVRELTFEEVCPALCYNVQEDLFYGVNTKGEFVSVTKEGVQTPLIVLDIPNLSSTLAGIAYSPKDDAYIFNAYLKDGNSAFYRIDPKDNSCEKMYDTESGEEYIYMVCADPNALPTSPAMAGFVSDQFEGSALKGTLSYTLPAVKMNGEALSGNLYWRLLVDGEKVIDGTHAAGSLLSFETPELSNDTHTFAFMVSADNEHWSAPAVMQRCVGSDYPDAPSGVTLDNEGNVKWEAVDGTGTRGGFVDLNNLVYKVYLNGEEQGETRETGYKVSFPEGKPFASYHAAVVASSDAKQSEQTLSNAVTFGEPWEINPSVHFRPEEEEFELFQAVDLDGKTDESGMTRNWHFSTTMGFPSFASGADGDDLLIFPPMNFSTSAKVYRFEMEAGLIRDIDKSGTIEVVIGKEPNLESMTQTIIPPTRCEYMRGDIIVEYFAVPSPGTYYIGIRTKTGQVAYHVSDVDISTTDIAAQVPVQPSAISATPGENGALTATVNFTMPTLLANGEKIPEGQELVAVVTSREFVPYEPDQGEVTEVKRVSGHAGEAMEVEISTIQNDNTIAVAVEMNGNLGSEAYTKVYTGLVKPYIVQNLKIVADPDNLGATLTWTPPVEADDEEGPIGEDFFYTVWYYGSGWQYLGEVGWNELTKHVELDPDSPQGPVLLGVMALNAAGQSTHIASQSLILGLPYYLPMNENFPEGYETYSQIMIQRPTDEYANAQWTVNDPSELSPIFSNETGIAYIGWVPEESAKSGKGRLSIPKFSTVGEGDVTFSLKYWGGQYGAPMSLHYNIYGMEGSEKVGDFPAGNGWVTNSLTLPAAAKEQEWVEVCLDAFFKDNNTFALFSGYSITGVSGVNGVSVSEGRIFAGNGMIHIAGHAGDDLVISDLEGRVLVKVASLEDLSGFCMSKGQYVVRAGRQTAKVVVK